VLLLHSTATNFVTVAALAAMISSVLILFLNRLLYRCICPDESFPSKSLMDKDDYDSTANHSIAASLDDGVAINKCKSNFVK
jgi:hypothetical protein